MTRHDDNAEVWNEKEMLKGTIRRLSLFDSFVWRITQLD